MKTLIKIVLSIVGIPAVIYFLCVAVIRRLMGTFPITADSLVLVYSQVAWDEVWQRPQQYAWYTSRDIPVVYCAPVQPHNFIYLGRKWQAYRQLSKRHQLHVLSPLIFSGHYKSRVINAINNAIVRAWLRLAIPSHTHVYGLVNTPLGYPVIKGFLPFKSLVYDIIDDFTLFAWYPSFARPYDGALTALAHTTITGTAELARLRPGATFVPSGANFELFSTPAPPPEGIAQLPRPILGYFGTISERLDFDLILCLARHFSTGSIVMIGPVHLPDSQMAHAPNIHYLGLKSHATLPGYAQAFDVALIPFRLTPATLKLNPVKTLEYLSTGKPVVATPLPDLQSFYSDCLYLADPENFTDAVHQALVSPDPHKISRGITLAQTASWQEMTNQMNALLLKDNRQQPENRTAPL